jgi:ferredoxin
MPIHFYLSQSEKIEVPCYSQLNLLAHAQLEELEVGSRCGGHGICGNDRIKVSKAYRDKLSPITKAEQLHLSKEDLNDGWRLACQCWPVSNESTIEVSFKFNDDLTHSS